MKNLILLVSCIITGLSYFNAQTTATNFNCDDCKNDNYDLFTELDAGKIIVITWVMPCTGCLNPAKTAHDVVQSYSASNPGQVFFYLVDDYANNTCSSIVTWALNNDIDSARIFSNASINMSDYGADGMPKIVVLGGTDHKIYYNENMLTDGPGVQAAIDLAISESSFGIDELTNQNFQLSVFPNPTIEENILVSYNLETAGDVSIDIYNALGTKVESENLKGQIAGNYEEQLDLSDLTSGVYFLKLTVGTRFDKLKFVKSE